MKLAADIGLAMSLAFLDWSIRDCITLRRRSGKRAS